jgi:hypothetical protein
MPLRWRRRPRFDGMAAGERSLAGHERSVQVASQFRYPRSHPLTLNDQAPASRSQVALPRRGQLLPFARGTAQSSMRPLRFIQPSFDASPLRSRVITKNSVSP